VENRVKRIVEQWFRGKLNLDVDVTGTSEVTIRWHKGSFQSVAADNKIQINFDKSKNLQ